MRVTLVAKQDRAQQVGMLVESLQKATGASVELAYVDQSYTREDAEETETHGVRLEVVKHPEAKGASCFSRVGG